ncbi:MULTISPECIES: hypothetical protein [Pseudomonas]|uniref:Uncharacterized protein n=1 Tax=Pseudomonas taiwanensis TaxID=470150 RepID=A0ABR6V669_9PSED|nr:MULTISPECIES: hypothetical protein [Pseudomonas]AVD87896.1 hypothetical protein C4Q26_12320 [Pseudomonas sp. SWI44]MBC3475883.1 hypothetical protein [Pseudomonas taiwanensis]MBC3490373.1 hypothetical protein [Pseudomonas taiwanensis]
MNKPLTHNTEQQSHLPNDRTQFHVVSISKYAIMGVFTLGLYIAYCNYRHWLHIRGQRGLKLTPLLCTLFGGLTMYWLMKNIVARSREVNQSVEGTALGVTLMWWIPYLVTLSWDLFNPENFLNSLPLMVRFLMTITLVFAIATFGTVSLLRIQQAANACAGDPLGLQNSKITWVNIFWIMISWLPITAIFVYVAGHAALI